MCFKKVYTQVPSESIILPLISARNARRCTWTFNIDAFIWVDLNKSSMQKTDLLG